MIREEETVETCLVRRVCVLVYVRSGRHEIPHVATIALKTDIIRTDLSRMFIHVRAIRF